MTCFRCAADDFFVMIFFSVVTPLHAYGLFGFGVWHVTHYPLNDFSLCLDFWILDDRVLYQYCFERMCTSSDCRLYPELEKTADNDYSSTSS